MPKQRLQLRFANHLIGTDRRSFQPTLNLLNGHFVSDCRRLGLNLEPSCGPGLSTQPSSQSSFRPNAAAADFPSWPSGSTRLLRVSGSHRTRTLDHFRASSIEHCLERSWCPLPRKTQVTARGLRGWRSQRDHEATYSVYNASQATDSAKSLPSNR